MASPSRHLRPVLAAALAAAVLTAGCGGDEPSLGDADASRLLQGIERVRSAASAGDTAAALSATTRLRASFATLEDEGAFAPAERTALRSELRRLQDVLDRRRDRERARARAKAREAAQKREAEALAAQQAAAAAAAAAAPSPAPQPQERSDRKREDRDDDDDRRRDEQAQVEQAPEAVAGAGERAGGDHRGREGKPGKAKGHDKTADGGGRALPGAGGDGDFDDGD